MTKLFLVCPIIRQLSTALKVQLKVLWNPLRYINFHILPFCLDIKISQAFLKTALTSVDFLVWNQKPPYLTSHYYWRKATFDSWKVAWFTQQFVILPIFRNFFVRIYGLFNPLLCTPPSRKIRIFVVLW